MPIKFEPVFTITPQITKNLLQIESVRGAIQMAPIAVPILKTLRESAQLLSTHYSTKIEGNRLESEQVEKVIKHKGHFPGRQRDEREVKGYYTALSHVEQLVARNEPISEKIIQKIHALATSDGRLQVKPTPYRDGQNVIRQAGTGEIVYMPPEAHDVPGLMRGLIDWINHSELPAPIVAGIAHYQFVTIHPYYDGNGRTARLLAVYILYSRGYDLKGIYSLEEYYARNLGAYYDALTIGPSHNYYFGRAEADITGWVDYFTAGMAYACQKVLQHVHALGAKRSVDHSALLRLLDPKQRKVLELFFDKETITARDVGHLFGFQPRTSSAYCNKWVEDGFLIVHDPSKKARSYRLAEQFRVLIQD